MPEEVTELVRQQARKYFSPEDAALVLDEFEPTGLPLINNNGERVHLAVLYLSKGRLALFDETWSLAKIDWRDTLVAAGLANEDWPEVLRQSVIRP